MSINKIVKKRHFAVRGHLLHDHVYPSSLDREENICVLQLFDNISQREIGKERKRARWIDRQLSVKQLESKGTG